MIVPSVHPSVYRVRSQIRVECERGSEVGLYEFDRFRGYHRLANPDEQVDRLRIFKLTVFQR